MTTSASEYADMPCLVIRFHRLQLIGPNRDREVVLTAKLPDDAEVARAHYDGRDFHVRVTSKEYREKFTEDILWPDSRILTSRIWDQMKASWDSQTDQDHSKD